MTPTDTPRRRRWPWILLAVLVALPLAGWLALRAFVNPDALRPRLVAAVEQATGRRLAVGDITLALSLRPAVALHDVRLSNAEGGSRPDMLTAKRVEVQAALIPLLSRRLEIARVVLEEPDILLEPVAGGRGNWEFSPARPATTPAARPGQPSASSPPFVVSVDAARIERATLTWRGGATPLVIEIPRLDATIPHDGPVGARGTLAVRGEQIGIVATTGPLAALGGAAPWPVEATLSALGGELRLRGTLAGAAWNGGIAGTLPEATRLAGLLPGVALPPLREIAFSGRVSGNGGALAAAEDLVLRIGASDLSAYRPGLSLLRAEVTAPRLDAPLALTAEARLGEAPLEARGTLGTPALLLGTAGGPLPVDLRLAASGATATLRGTVRDPVALAGVDLALAAQVPDLAALSPLAGMALPTLRDLRAEARLAERGARFAEGAQLRGIVIESTPFAARGELTLALAARPSLRGGLEVARLDLDALRAAMPSVAPASPAPAAPPANAPAPAPAAPPAAAPAAERRLIPDTPLPFAALRGFDAELQLAIATLTTRGTNWRDIRLPVKLENGQGSIAPFAVATPGGALSGEIAADATAAAPTLRLVVRAPALQLAPLQQAFGQPVYVSGRGELDADLRGAGTTLRALAASLGGHLGLAVLDGTLEPALLGPVAQGLRQRVPLLPQLPQRLPLDCAALRADATDGLVRIGTLLIDAPAAKVAGSGTINLGDEAVALRLLHDIRAAGVAVRVAGELGGTLANATYRGVRAENLGDVIGGLAGRLGGDAGQLLGALANRSGGRPEPLPECGPALAAARGGRYGPVPAARPAPAAEAAPAPAQADQPQRPAIPGVPPSLQGPAGDLLRGLLRR
jgi:AsmA protein